MSGTTEQLIEHDEFNSLTMMMEWFRLEWPDDFETTDDVVELEEDYELEKVKCSFPDEDVQETEEISQPELSSTEV